MPLLNGIEAVRQIKKAQGDIKIVFLTMHPDVTYAASAFEAGASGYVLKHSAPSELITAITSVLAGQQYVTPLIARELMEFYRDGGHKQRDGLTGSRPVSVKSCSYWQRVARQRKSQLFWTSPPGRWNFISTKCWKNLV